MPLIGVLSPSSVVGAARNIKAFRQVLRDLGYVEGQNVAIEYRFAEGVLERLTSLTTELVALNSSVIVVGSTSGIVGPPPQRTLPAVRQAILELIARLPPQRCPHCQKWIRNEQRRE